MMMARRSVSAMFFTGDNPFIRLPSGASKQIAGLHWPITKSMVRVCYRICYAPAIKLA